MSTTKEISADFIAKSFIKQYYDMFSRNPSELHRFYKEESAFTHAEVHQEVDVIHGINSIRERVIELNLRGATVDVSEGSIDAQRTENNGVFLTVTGTVTLPSSAPATFVQSFLLATQTGNNKAASYFVRNSVFRLLTVPVDNRPVTAPVPSQTISIAPVQVQVVESVDTTQAVSATTVEEETVAVAETEDVEEIPEAEEDVFEEEAEPLDAEPGVEETEEEYEEQVYEPSPAVEPQAPAAPSPPKSFADVVKRLAGPPATGPAAPAPAPGKGGRGPTKKDKVKVADAEEQTPLTHPAAPKPQQQRISLYVSQLSEEASEEDLRQLFGKFGIISSVNVQGDRGFAFVDFADSVGAKAAMAQAVTEPFVLRERTLKLEERQVRSRSKNIRTPYGARQEGRGRGAEGPRDGAHRVDGRGRRDRDAGRGRGGRGGDHDGESRPNGGGRGAGGPKRERQPAQEFR